MQILHDQLGVLLSTEEKITIAKLKVSKSGYSERYEPYELIAEACIENWENCIRNGLARSFHFEPDEISLT
ncbi:hypothetical protein B9X75_12895 [Acinetobacter pittii]|uniref:hypothetical protein n=1 Tax=Acinetobacter pittii TaxID=48296 RepID=UPI000A32DF53|nr:hypothetical protein [Acinetobacter pittii]OTL32574.1 hypothetical protein B9X75_12895 [Acinetobacter pittii]